MGGATKAIPIPPRFRGWDHVLLDIVPLEDVDIVWDARELTAYDAGVFDAVYCSHNLEHFTEEETPAVLAGFLHVLRPGGFVEIHVPDGDQIDAAVAQVGMDGVVYWSAEGPITPRDMIHGHQATIERGGVYMAHHQVFYRPHLVDVLRQAGFVDVRAWPLAWELEAVGFTAGLR